MAQAAETPGHALAVAHKRKLDKSWQSYNEQGIVFWYNTAISKVKKLGGALARHTGEEETTTIRHLFQQLSIALAKGNAALFSNQIPSDNMQGDEGFGW